MIFKNWNRGGRSRSVDGRVTTHAVVRESTKGFVVITLQNEEKNGHIDMWLNENEATSLILELQRRMEWIQEELT